MTKPKVLVIGGGLTGCSASLKLAELGFNVVLVEMEHFLGGHARQLGKFFPTEDCALCVPSIKPVQASGGFRKCMYRSEIADHPQVKIITGAKVLSIKRGERQFKVNFIHKPRYVDRETCISCRACEEVCPIARDEGLPTGYTTKAIFRDPATVPPTYLIDMSVCNKCGECVKVCPTQAIDLTDRDTTTTTSVDSIIVASGFQEKLDLPPQIVDKISTNVISQTQLAELLNKARITKTSLDSPVTKKPVTRVIIGLCTGSRTPRVATYCSEICCTYALKHSLLLRDQGIDVTVCFMDIRTKGYNEKYYDEARTKGVQFIKGLPALLKLDKDQIHVYIENTQSSTIHVLPTDLFVYTPPLVPSSATYELLEILPTRIKSLSSPLYVNTSPNRSNAPQIYFCGTNMKARDLPSVVNHVEAVVYKIVEDSRRGKVR